MEATIEAQRLENQVYEENYSLGKELKDFYFDPAESVMDAGCGTGVLSRYLVEQKGIRLVDAIDFSDLRLKQGDDLLDHQTKSAIKFYKQDLSHIDSQFHNRYDTVFCRFVIEHSEDPLKILQELRKTLKPNGRIIVIELDGVFINLYSENKQFNDYMNELKKNFRFDLNIGRKVPNMLKTVGFSKITWDTEQLCCKGKRLNEERANTEKRFTALRPFLIEKLGSTTRAEEFRQLYLEEMIKEENTLVFNKYICSGVVT